MMSAGVWQPTRWAAVLTRSFDLEERLGRWVVVRARMVRASVRISCRLKGSVDWSGVFLLPPGESEWFRVERSNTTGEIVGVVDRLTDCRASPAMEYRLDFPRLSVEAHQP